MRRKTQLSVAAAIAALIVSVVILGCARAAEEPKPIEVPASGGNAKTNAAPDILRPD